MSQSYDIVIIGAGPGGYVAAIKAARLGGKVGVIEKEEVGGTCINRGCIPTKALLSSSNLLSLIRRAPEFGIQTGEINFDFQAMMARKNKIVNRLVEGIKFLFRQHKIDLITGYGSLLEPGLVEVIRDSGESDKIHAAKVIIATGSESLVYPSFNFDGVSVLTSWEVLSLQELPSRMVIIGGSVVGCEFACFFSQLGMEVTILEMLPQILPTEDRTISRHLEAFFRKRGIKVFTQKKVQKINSGRTAEVILESGETFTAEKVLVAVGRRLNSSGIGLEKVGVETEKGRVVVNERMETNIPGIYAVGDVTGQILLAHVASHQGMVAAQNALGKKVVMDYRVVPNCIFTSPEIASVGLTEEKAQEMGYEVKTGRFNFAANGKAVSMGEVEGWVKLVTDARTGRVLGACILGPHATDLIAEVVLGMHLGASAEQIGQTIHAHPTLSEAIMEAAFDVNKMAINAI